MNQLLLGIFLFFGAHSLSIVAPGLRDRLAAKSELGFKAVYGIASLLGLVLMSRGYAELRLTSALLYVTPVWLRHVAAVLMLPVFGLFIAPYFPGRIKAAVKNPQLVAVMLWSVAHLSVNGSLADVLLFAPFLLWAVADLVSLRRRTPRPVPGAPPSGVNDLIVVVGGLALYALFGFWLHAALFGARPFVM